MSFYQNTIFEFFKNKKSPSMIFLISHHVPYNVIKHIHESFFHQYNFTLFDQSSHNSHALLFQNLFDETPHTITFISYTYDNNHIHAIENIIYIAEHKNPCIIHIDTFIAKQILQYEEYMFFLDSPIEKRNIQECNSMYNNTYNEYIQLLFEIFPSIHPEFLATSLRYAPFLRKQLWQQYVKTLYSKNISSLYTLFDLATLFFSRNKEFWNIWNGILHEHENDFWTLFWTDQLWLCFCYNDTMQRNTKVTKQQQNIFKKLPRTVLQYSWKDINKEDLAECLLILFEQDTLHKKHSIFDAITVNKMLFTWFKCIH
jgi:hypothetical protein